MDSTLKQDLESLNGVSEVRQMFDGGIQVVLEYKAPTYIIESVELMVGESGVLDVACCYDVVVEFAKD